MCGQGWEGAPLSSRPGWNGHSACGEVGRCLYNSILDGEPTWIEIKDDIQQILVSPCDGILVLLVQMVQHDLPGQACWDHAALEERKHHSS